MLIFRNFFKIPQLLQIQVATPLVLQHNNS